MFPNLSSRRIFGAFGLALALCSGLAAADTFDAGNLPQSNVYTLAVSHAGSFADIFNFRLTGAADVSAAASVLNLDLGTLSVLRIDSPALSLFSAASPGSPIMSGSTNVFAANLAAGDYFAKVTGNATGAAGGNYLMGLYSVVTTPIPEPEQWGMFVAGMLAVAAAVRRKTGASA